MAGLISLYRYSGSYNVDSSVNEITKLEGFATPIDKSIAILLAWRYIVVSSVSPSARMVLSLVSRQSSRVFRTTSGIGILRLGLSLCRIWSAKDTHRRKLRKSSGGSGIIIKYYCLNFFFFQVPPAMTLHFSRFSGLRPAAWGEQASVMTGPYARGGGSLGDTKTPIAKNLPKRSTTLSTTWPASKTFRCWQIVPSRCVYCLNV